MNWRYGKRSGAFGTVAARGNLMKVNSHEAAEHLQQVVERAGLLVQADKSIDDHATHDLVEVHALLLHALKRCCPPASVYDERVKRIVGEGDPERGPMLYEIERLYGVAKALQLDWSLDHLQTFGEMVHAELFSDMLQAAAYLLGEGYKDAAAVNAGGVLEQHIRALCDKHGLPTTVTDSQGSVVPKKANVLIADLQKQGVYDKNTHKHLVWLTGLRNAAAHAEYQTYTAKDVELMIEGVRQFIANYPA